MTRITLTPDQIAEAAEPGAVSVDLYAADGEPVRGPYSGRPSLLVIDVGRLRVELPLNTLYEGARRGAAHADSRRHGVRIPAHHRSSDAAVSEPVSMSRCCELPPVSVTSPLAPSLRWQAALLVRTLP